MNETVYLFALSNPDLLQRILALSEAPILLPSRFVPPQVVPVVRAVPAA